MAEQTDTGIVAVKSELCDTAPWKSLWWLTLLFLAGHLLISPLQTFRLVAILYLDFENDSALVYLIEVANAICAMGILVHVTLASLCLAWTVGKLWQRALIFILQILSGGLLWLVGYVASSPVALLFLDPESAAAMMVQVDWSDETTIAKLVVVAAAAPIVLLGVQFPLWIARAAGWRLIQPGMQSPASRESLSISDLMVATGVVGVCLAVLQVGRPYLTENAEDPLVYLAVALGSAVASAVVITAIAWPLAWAFLKPLRWSQAWLTTIGIATTAFVLFLLLFLVMYRGINVAVSCGIATMVFSYVGGVAGGLAMLRRDGWLLPPRREGAAPL